MIKVINTNNKPMKKSQVKMPKKINLNKEIKLLELKRDHEINDIKQYFNNKINKLKIKQ
jgi:hypothetical protein